MGINEVSIGGAFILGEGGVHGLQGLPLLSSLYMRGGIVFYIDHLFHGIGEV